MRPSTDRQLTGPARPRVQESRLRSRGARHLHAVHQAGQIILNVAMSRAVALRHAAKARGSSLEAALSIGFWEAGPWE